METTKIRNQKIVALNLDTTATILVNYNGLKNTTHKVFEIVGTRVTIKINKIQTDFNINEVILKPIAYNEKEAKQIQQVTKIIKIIRLPFKHININ